MASRSDRNTALLAFQVRDSCTRLALTNLIVTALKWFDAQGTVSDYEGGRDLDSLAVLCAS